MSKLHSRALFSLTVFLLASIAARSSCLPVVVDTPLVDGDREALVLALEDERRSEATYRAVLDRLGDVRPFSNVVVAEGRHAAHLVPWFEAADLEVPENPFTDSPPAAPATRLEACREAIASENANIALYDRILPGVESPELRQTLEHLRTMSAEHHLPAFQRCASGGPEGGHGMGSGPGPRHGAGGGGHGRGGGHGARGGDGCGGGKSSCPCRAGSSGD